MLIDLRFYFLWEFGSYSSICLFRPFQVFQNFYQAILCFMDFRRKERNSIFTWFKQYRQCHKSPVVDNWCLFTQPKAGVSNTQPSSRMWPARGVCAAPATLKRGKNPNLWFFLSQIWTINDKKVFRYVKSNCDMWSIQKTFFLQMWPFNGFEFETPEQRLVLTEASTFFLFL